MSQPAHYDMAGIRDTTAIPTEGAQPLCTTTPVTIPSSVTATTTCEKMLKESGPWEGTEPCNAGHKGDNTACTDIFEHQSFNPNGISAYHPQPAGISPSKKVTSTVLSISIIGKSTVALIPKHPLQESSHLFSTSKLETSSSPRMVPCPSVPIVQEVLPSHLPVAQPELASETLSYLESASMMSGTLGSLSGLVEDGSSLGSDSEVGFELRRVDKYGFLGGAQYSEDSMGTIRAKVSRQREIKWLEMFNNWDKWASQRFQKVKVRCRKGIPSSLRAKAWQLLSNSRELLDSNPGKFEALERELGDPKWLDVIEKDLHRQFPFHEMFAARGGHGQQDLYRILKAYTVYRPQEGYCQAQAPVAAVLLMHMPAEQAFWCLVQICEVYLPGYYSAGLEAVQLDGEILFSLLRRFCPMAYRHLRKFKIDPILYMTEWFMCIFSRSLPWACVLRVWDMFFCEGVKIIFRVGLVLLKQILGSVDKLQKMQGMYETLECLKKLPLEAIREELLVQEVISVAVTEALIERECRLHVQKWRESRGELFLNPDRRLHGTRAIYEQKQRLTFNTPRSTFSFLGVSDSTHGLTVAPSSLLSLPSFFRSKSLIRIPERNGSFTGTETHTNQNLSVLSESNLGVYDRSKEMSTDKPSHTLAQQPPHRLTLSSPHQQSLTTLGRPAEVSACVPSSAAHSSIPLDASATERGAKKKWEKKEEKLKVREHKAEDKVEKIKQVKEWANKQKPKANVQMGDQQKQEPG